MSGDKRCYSSLVRPNYEHYRHWIPAVIEAPGTSSRDINTLWSRQCGMGPLRAHMNDTKSWNRSCVGIYKPQILPLTQCHKIVTTVFLCPVHLQLLKKLAWNVSHLNQISFKNLNSTIHNSCMITHFHITFVLQYISPGTLWRLKVSKSYALSLSTAA